MRRILTRIGAICNRNSANLSDLLSAAELGLQLFSPQLALAQLTLQVLHALSKGTRVSLPFSQSGPCFIQSLLIEAKHPSNLCTGGLLSIRLTNLQEPLVLLSRTERLLQGEQTALRAAVGGRHLLEGLAEGRGLFLKSRFAFLSFQQVLTQPVNVPLQLGNTSFSLCNLQQVEDTKAIQEPSLLSEKVWNCH